MRRKALEGIGRGGYTEAESVYNPYVTDGAGDGGDKALNLPPHPNQFPGGSDSKASAYNAGDPGSIPGLGRSSGELATHSCTLAWKIPWTEEHCRLKTE